MKKHWRELIIFALVLLLTTVGCGQSATPTPLPPPTDVPEVLASKNEDVLGVWLMTSPPSDPLGPSDQHVEYRADGARIATIISGMHKGYRAEAKFWLEGGLLKIHNPQGTGEANSTSIGTYQVYVTKRGGMPVQLRFVVVDDAYVNRKDRMTYKPSMRVEP
ncbi:MAG: hypothetical protein HY865_25325 [Chloroflexi bacterium]|nr:hypothetical protein [Chloroflexota bacterium]